MSHLGVSAIMSGVQMYEVRMSFVCFFFFNLALVDAEFLH